ncbi:MAG: hypothetical protein AB1721_00955 [Patescibacteria group bacterium]
MFSLGFIIISFLVGACFFDWLDFKNEIRGFSFFVFSLALGLVVLGYLNLGLSLIFQNLIQGLIWGLVLASVFLIRFFKPRKIFKNRWQKIVFSPPQLILGTIVIVFIIVALQAMLFDSSGFPFGILKGWGDGAYHLNMVMRLATADPFVLDQPIAGAGKLTYPFLINFLSAVLLKGGLSLLIAWHLPIIVFGAGMILALFELGRNYFTRKSLAWILAFLVLFGAGLGFIWFFQQVSQDAVQQGWLNSFLNNFSEPKFEYTHLDTRTGGKLTEKNHPANIVWIVPIISFFSHQRSFVLGAFLGFLLLFGLLIDKKNWRRSQTRQPHQTWRWLLLLGFLPLAHTHSFLGLVIFVLVFCFKEIFGSLREFFKDRRVNQFLRFGFISFLIALPQLVYLLSGIFSRNGNGGFFIPWFGWMSCEHSFNWFFCNPNVFGTDSSALWFWLKNFGLIFIVWLFAVLFYGFKKLNHQAKELVLPSLVLFALPNLFLFQPWPFDNNKILFWWWVLAALISLSLFDAPPRNYESEIMNQGGKYKFIILNSLFIILIILGSFSGIIDVWARVKTGLRLEKNVRNFGYYSEQDLVIADWIKENSSPNDAILSHGQANQFIPMTTGRPIYLGFIGWLWTQGQSDLISQRQAKIKNFVSTENVSELCQDAVKYWLKEPRFFADYPNPLNNDFSEAGEKVFEYNNKEIIKFNCD